MLPVMVERLVDAIIFRMSVITPGMGHPVVKYQGCRIIKVGSLDNITTICEWSSC